MTPHPLCLQRAVTSSDMLTYLRERLGGQAQLQEAISRRRSLTRYRLTVMQAVGELFAEECSKELLPPA